MHCTQCHDKDKAVIPSLVLHKLNFKKQSVCRSAKRFLDTMYKVRCIDLNMFNVESSKIKKNKKLNKLKRILSEFEQFESYWMDNYECTKIDILMNDCKEYIVCDGLLSLSDCVRILSSNKTLNAMQTAINELKKHIFSDCALCGLKRMKCANVCHQIKAKKNIISM